MWGLFAFRAQRREVKNILFLDPDTCFVLSPKAGEVMPSVVTCSVAAVAAALAFVPTTYIPTAKWAAVQLLRSVGLQLWQHLVAELSRRSYSSHGGAAGVLHKKVYS